MPSADKESPDSATIPAPTPPDSDRELRDSTLTRQRRRAAYLFVAPMLVVLAMVAGYPLLRTMFFALTDARLSNLSTYHFVGLANFMELVRDPVWWQAVWNTVVFSVVSVALETVLGVAIALTLSAHMPGRGLLRAAVLSVFKQQVNPGRLRDIVVPFDEGAVVHTGEDVTSADLARLVEDVPALRESVAALAGGDESPAVVASAVELVLEGLHLSKRLNKDALGGRATYRSRM